MTGVVFVMVTSVLPPVAGVEAAGFLVMPGRSGIGVSLIFIGKFEKTKKIEVLA